MGFSDSNPRGSGSNQVKEAKLTGLIIMLMPLPYQNYTHSYSSFLHFPLNSPSSSPKEHSHALPNLHSFFSSIVTHLQFRTSIIIRKTSSHKSSSPTRWLLFLSLFSSTCRNVEVEQASNPSSSLFLTDQSSPRCHLLKLLSSSSIDTVNSDFSCSARKGSNNKLSFTQPWTLLALASHC